MKKILERNKRGITLIALVITIIVLLILAGITINLTIGQDGIITTAQQAGKNYTQAYEDEQVQLEAINKEVNEMLNETTGQDSDDSTQTAVDRTGLNVGDYIDYTPDTAEGTKYEASKLATAITGSTGSWGDGLSVIDLQWQILRIYDDGSMDLIGSNANSIDFRGAIGYNNGVYVMNDICKTLYSRTSSGITARSVNIEDIEYWLQKDADGKTLKDKYVESGTNLAVGETKTYSGSTSYYPTLWARQTGAKITTSSGTTTVTTGGISESDAGYESATNETYLPQSPTSSDKITVTQTYWSSKSGDTLNETNFGVGAKALHSDNTYWVASRYVECESGYACFGFRSAGKAVSGYDVYTSSGQNRDYALISVRPVVHISKKVKITASSTATDKSTPHHIVSY